MFIHKLEIVRSIPTHQLLALIIAEGGLFSGPDPLSPRAA